MIKFIFKIAVYAFFIFLIGNGVAMISLYFIGKSNLYKPQFLKNGVKETNFDYLVLGSSTGLTTLDTKLIDKTLNTNGLNISLDDSSLSTHLLMLNYFLSLGKHTKRLVLCVTPWDLERKENKINTNDYRFLSEIDNPFVYNHYRTLEKNEFKVLTYSKQLPILGLSYYNIELFYPSLYTIVNPNKRNRFDDRGNYSYPKSNNILKDEPLKEVNVEIANPAFFNIQSLCKKENIELIVYQSPIYKTRINYPSSMNFKLINNKLILSKDLFYDDIHVNAKGRNFCTLEFCKEITK